MQANFDRFTLTMTKQDAAYASHAGNCDQEVADLVNSRKVTRQLDKIGPDAIRDELKEYGAWNDLQLSDDEENRQRIVWIAAGNINQERG